MQLKIPGGADAAIEALTHLKSQLESCRPGGDLQEARDAWLRWWGTADAQLRHLFADTDMVASLYQTQAELGRMNLGARPFGLLNREIDVWIDRFGVEIARLQALKWFTEFQGQIVVPDTSAFIEGPYFADFDWYSLEGITVPAGPVRLIVPILVIEELDALRRDRDERVHKRARSVLSRLWELHGGSPTRPVALPGKQVTVEVFLDDPWHVRRPVNDDEIIERAQAIEAITGKAALLAAGDHAMLYRAAAAGLNAVLMPRQDEDAAAAADSSAQG